MQGSAKEPVQDLRPDVSDDAGPSFNATVKQLRAFLSVARQRSFTRAAIELQVSQPALTMAVRQLEDIFGAALFDRTRRTVVLTPEGSDFIPIAERLLSDFDLAIQDITASADRRRGQVGIGLVYSIATKVIPHVLPRFAAENPGVRAFLRDGNSSDVRRRVRRNEVDLGFASREDAEAELDFELLFRDQMGLLVHKSHPLARSRGALRWADLSGYDFIGLTPDTATRPLLRQIAEMPELIASPRFEVSNSATLFAVLEAGVGITTAPAMSVFGGAGNGLVFRALEDPVTRREVFVITRRGRSLTAPARSIIEMVRERVRSMSKASPMIEVAG